MTMAETVGSSAVKPPGLTTVLQAPRLCTGDRLTRAEFERRYSARPDVKKAELIEGVVYIIYCPRSLTRSTPIPI